MIVITNIVIVVVVVIIIGVIVQDVQDTRGLLAYAGQHSRRHSTHQDV